MNIGIFNKYVIKKANGQPVDPEAKYFVLRFDEDRHARTALRAYADSAQGENPKLAEELRAAVAKEDTLL